MADYNSIYTGEQIDAAVGNAKTAADLKTAYESNADTNAFTDAEQAKLANQSGVNTGDQDISGIATNASAISTLESEQITQNSAIALNTAKRTYPLVDENKLAGIEDGADVTDATNVAAAGAVMTDSDATLDSLQLNGGAGTQGTMAWNTDEELVAITLNGVTMYAGEDGVWNVRNATGSTILKGTPVMAVGTVGNSGRILIDLMDGTDSANAKYYLGQLGENLPNDTDGKVYRIGKLRNITTDGSDYSETWTNGDVIYISTSVAGELTNVAPLTGLKLAIAFVINAHATNGVLAVRASNLDENRLLTDAQISLIASALQSGDNVSELTNDAGYLTATTGQKKAARQTLTDGASVDWNAVNGNIATLTLGGNRTINAPTNLYDESFILFLKQDATGSRTVTWNAVFKWSDGTAPTLSTAANAVDIITFVWDGTNLYGSMLPNFS